MSTRLLFFVFVVFSAFFSRVEAVNSFSGKTDEITGRAEIRKSGETNWRFLVKGDTVADNDKIRTYPGSFVRVSFPEGSEFIIRDSTEIRFNFFEKDSLMTKAVNCFIHTGKVFVGIANKPGFRSFNKIFTHNSLTEAGEFKGLFFVSADTTDIYILDGRAIIRNKKDTVGIVYPANRTALLIDTAAPTPPIPMDSAQLKRASGVIGEDKLTGILIAAEIAGEKRDARLDRDYRKYLKVAFTDKSGYEGKWDIAGGIEDASAYAIDRASAFVVQKEPGGSLPTGGKARYQVRGTIKTFEFGKKTAFRVSTGETREFLYIHANIEVELYDTDKKELVKQFIIDEKQEAPAKNELELLKFSRAEFRMSTPLIAESFIGMFLRNTAELCSQETLSGIE
ncbi:MAG: hypothetical protein ACLFQK_08930 [Fibrobacterota bacterium]